MLGGSDAQADLMQDLMLKLATGPQPALPANKVQLGLQRLLNTLAREDMFTDQPKATDWVRSHQRS
jgi:hypothetical protein